MVVSTLLNNQARKFRVRKPCRRRNKLDELTESLEYYLRHYI